MNQTQCLPTLLIAIGAFLAGSIPFGLILMKLAGKGDVRANIGATNVMRVGGKGLGIATLVLDVLKGYLPVLVASQVGLGPVPAALVAVAAVAGHMFTPWLKFKGGKGVATALGTVLAYHPAMVLPALAVFILCVLIFRFISLGSILAAVTLVLTALGVAGAWATLPVPPPQALWPPLCWTVIAALVIIKHHANIGRLLHGTESKFWGAKPSAK